MKPDYSRKAKFVGSSNDVFDFKKASLSERIEHAIPYLSNADFESLLRFVEIEKAHRDGLQNISQITNN